MKHYLSSLFFLCTVLAAFTQSANIVKDVSSHPADQDRLQVSTTDTAPINFNDTTESEYPGGVEAWYKYLNRKTSIRPAQKNNAPPGKYVVIAQFEVAPDGSVTKVEALSKIGYGMEEMLVAVIQKSKKWIPATINGKPVRSFKKQPIVLVVSEGRPGKVKKDSTSVGTGH